MEKFKKRTRKTIVSIIGGVVLLCGIIAIPYPGPGWLIVFAGLAILAPEFQWADRLLQFARSRYDMWTDWLRRQHIVIRLLVLALTGIIIIVTIWLLNGFGMLVDLFNLPFDWLRSPWF